MIKPADGGGGGGDDGMGDGNGDGESDAQVTVMPPLTHAEAVPSQ